MSINKVSLPVNVLLTVFVLLCLNVMSSSRTGKEKTFKIPTEHPPDTGSLKRSLIDFMAKADSDKFDEIIPYYDSDFVSIRIPDQGKLVKMTYNQMIYFWKMQAGKQPMENTFNHRLVITKSTTIQYIEILNNTGYVIITRVKDLGNGPETLFYNLMWVYKNNRWYLLREIVHQKTLPDLHK